MSKTWPADPYNTTWGISDQPCTLLKVPRAHLVWAGTGTKASVHAACTTHSQSGAWAARNTQSMGCVQHPRWTSPAYWIGGWSKLGPQAAHACQNQHMGLVQCRHHIHNVPQASPVHHVGLGLVHAACSMQDQSGMGYTYHAWLEPVQDLQAACCMRCPYWFGCAQALDVEPLCRTNLPCSLYPAR